MIKIYLNKTEHSYLCHASFLEEKYRKLVFSFEQNGETYSLKISEDQADGIRDACGEQMQIIGFNKNYELTSEGEILESLIDKFFIT